MQTFWNKKKKQSFRIMKESKFKDIVENQPQDRDNEERRVLPTLRGKQKENSLPLPENQERGLLEFPQEVDGEHDDFDLEILEGMDYFDV